MEIVNVKEIKLSVATKADVKSVLKIIRPYYDQGIMGFNPPIAYFSAMESGGIIVAKNADMVVGFLFIKLPKRSNICKIQQIAKIKETMIKGIGTLLVNKAKTMAKEGRYAGIELKVRQTNTSAIDFYKKHGFQEIGQEENNSIMSINF